MNGHPEDHARHGNRLRLRLTGELRTGDRTSACEVMDVSRGGALVLGELLVSEGEAVELAINSQNGPSSIRLTGKVLRVEDDPDERGRHVALRFDPLGDSQRNDLEIFLARVLETPAVNPLGTLTPGSSLQEIKKTLEAIPIAKRIALAARAGPREREFLRHDTSAAVLDALVHNPGFGLLEARWLVGSVYISGATVEAFANDRRFNGDDDIRMAVAAHPKASLTTAERVTADLKVPQIKLILARPGLNLILREKLFRRTTKR